MKLTRLIDTNLKIYTFANSFWGIAIGLFAPFYFIFIQQMGGSIENYGIAIGLMLIAQAITAYFAGKYSDKIGRRPFLISIGYIYAIIIIFYTLITDLWHLYALQILNGIISSIDITMDTAFLGDLTFKRKRGFEVGKFNMIVGLCAAFGVIIGGYLVGMYGYKIVFYIVAILDIIGSTILFRIKERR